MPRLKRASKRRDLSPGERCQLLHGRNYFTGAEGFADEEGRRDAWREHGERLLAAWAAEGNVGRRPDAWWRYESPEPRNRDEHETLQLTRLGLLTEAERAELERRWRRTEGFAREVEAHADREAYWRYRRENGVPDDWTAPGQPIEDDDDPDEDAAPWAYA